MRISDTPPTPFPAKLDFIRAELEQQHDRI